MIYTVQDAEALQAILVAPHVSVRLSTIGGAQRSSLMILVSLDDRSTWANNIMENSRHARFSVTSGEHTIENFVRSPRSMTTFRKCSAETLPQIAEKINTWINKNL